MQHPRQDHNLYKRLSDANTMADNAELSSLHVHRELTVFRHIPCGMSDLPKPDHLHTMQIGMLDHSQKWIFLLMKTHERLDKYNAIWLSVPAYHYLTPKNMSSEEVSQWNEKEMKEMARYLLGIVTQSLRGRSPAQRPIFNHVIECTWVLLEFYIYARYKSCDDATLCDMQGTLRRFRTFKDCYGGNNTSVEYLTKYLIYFSVHTAVDPIPSSTIFHICTCTVFACIQSFLTLVILVLGITAGSDI